MTPIQIQFCKAVVEGKIALAQELRPKVNIFQENSFGCSPLLFCLWASYQKNPQVINQALWLMQEKNAATLVCAPDISAVAASVDLSVIPQLQSRIMIFLQSISVHVAPKASTFEAKVSAQQVFLNDALINACQMMLGTFLKECDSKVKLTSKLLKTLKEHHPTTFEDYLKNNKINQPDTVKKLLAAEKRPKTETDSDALLASLQQLTSALSKGLQKETKISNPYILSSRTYLPSASRPFLRPSFKTTFKIKPN